MTTLELIIGLGGGVLWLLGVSFTAGLAIQRSKENTRRLDAQDFHGERLARIESDVSWIKKKLQTLGSITEREER